MRSGALIENHNHIIWWICVVLPMELKREHYQVIFCAHNSLLMNHVYLGLIHLLFESSSEEIISNTMVFQKTIKYGETNGDCLTNMARCTSKRWSINKDIKCTGYKRAIYCMIHRAYYFMTYKTQSHRTAHERLEISHKWSIHVINEEDKWAYILMNLKED